MERKNHVCPITGEESRIDEENRHVRDHVFVKLSFDRLISGKQASRTAGRTAVRTAELISINREREREREKERIRIARNIQIQKKGAKRKKERQREKRRKREELG